MPDRLNLVKKSFKVNLKRALNKFVENQANEIEIN